MRAGTKTLIRVGESCFCHPAVVSSKAVNAECGAGCASKKWLSKAVHVGYLVVRKWLMARLICM